MNETKFLEVSRNLKICKFWKFQLSISFGSQKSAKMTQTRSKVIWSFNKRFKILLSHWWKFKFWLILLITYLYIFITFILGVGLLHDGTVYAILHSGLLGLSLEGLLRRNWLLLGDLFARYWNFCHPTSVIFRGLISLHLSFSQQLSPKVQPKPLCKFLI